MYVEAYFHFQNNNKNLIIHFNPLPTPVLKLVSLLSQKLVDASN